MTWQCVRSSKWYRVHIIKMTRYAKLYAIIKQYRVQRQQFKESTSISNNYHNDPKWLYKYWFTNSVHHKMSTHNGIVLEPTIEECSCATTHDARNAMFEPISECSVFTWSVAQTTRMAQRVLKASDSGPVAARRRWPASASYFLLLRWPASASTVTSFCFWPAPMEGPRPHPEVYHRMR